MDPDLASSPPIVAEMAEAKHNPALESVLQPTQNGPEGFKVTRSERLAVLEGLRDGSPIELDFNLQHTSQPQLQAPGQPVTPGVTAIAPTHTRQKRKRLPRGGAIYIRMTSAASRGLRRLGAGVGAGLGAAVRGTRRHAHRASTATAALLAHGAAAAVGATRAAAGAAAAGGGAAARASLAAAKLPVHAASAAARAGVAAAAAAAAQPARLGRLLCRLPQAPPLHALAGAARRGLRFAAPRRSQQPATVQPLRSAPAATPPAPPVHVGLLPAFQLPLAPASAEAPVLRARSLVAASPSAEQPAETAAAAASEATTAVASPRAVSLAAPCPPFEEATAKPIPALLLSGAAVLGPEPTGATSPVGAGAHRRTKGRDAGARQRRTAAAAHAGRGGSRLGAAAGLLRLPMWGALLAMRGAATAGRYGGAALLCAFFPRSCRLLGLAALLSGPHLPLPACLLGGAPLRNPLPPGRLRALLAPLGPLRRPFALFAALRAVGPVAAPAVWRNVQYWQRTVPIVGSYVWTDRRAASLRARGRPGAAEELWGARHEAGAGAIFDMLADLKGFYLKLGQILASKTDMLPQPYTESLSRLLDRLPPAPYRAVRRTIRSELGVWPEAVFAELDPFPLASATIAQVHRGRLPDGRPVVVKVQHPGARRAMSGDLGNLAALSRLLGAAGLELGFDHRALVEEYVVQVPLEFDFRREARVATSIRSSLSAASASFPALRRLVVPACVPALCSERLLTLEYLDGVPLLDIAGMELSVRHDLMTSLILAYGIMILRDGLFHSDPHPGNVLAMRRRQSEGPQNGLANGGVGGPSQQQQQPHPHGPGGSDADELRVALLDFGQAKELSDASRARYAMLVAAMAVRDDELVLEVSRELGLRVENCSEGFAAAATYILFDTRMDFPEAHMGPLHPDAHEFRTARVPALPQDLFMIMRVVTLLRGLLSSLRVDVSSAQLWRPLALQVLADMTPVPRGPMPGSLSPMMAASGGGSPYAVSPRSYDAAATLAADLAAVEPLDLTAAFFTPSSPAAVSPTGRSPGRGSGGGAAGGGLFGSAPGLVIPGKATAEALRRARRAEAEAAEAERRRLEREAAAAARQAEEARRKAEWDAAQRRKQEEKEARAARIKAAREAAEAKKAAERAEREARKRAEIEASNARRKAEREVAEARRRAEKEAAEARKREAAARRRSLQRAAEADRQRSQSAPPWRPPGPTKAAATADATSDGASPGTAARLQESPRSLTSAGIIHSPVPMRLSPSPLGVAGAASRFMPPGSRPAAAAASPAAAAASSSAAAPAPSPVVPAASGPAAAAGARLQTPAPTSSAAIPAPLVPTAQRAAAAAMPHVGMSAAAAAAPVGPLPGGAAEPVLRLPMPPAARGHPASPLAGSRFAPQTPPRIVSAATAAAPATTEGSSGGGGGGGGAVGDDAIAAAVSAALQDNPTEAATETDSIRSSLTISLAAVPLPHPTQSGISAGASALSGSAAARLSTDIPAPSSQHKAQEQDMDELTARLVERANALAVSPDRPSGAGQSQPSPLPCTSLAAPAEAAAAASSAGPHGSQRQPFEAQAYSQRSSLQRTSLPQQPDAAQRPAKSPRHAQQAQQEELLLQLQMLQEQQQLLLQSLSRGGAAQGAPAAASAVTAMPSVSSLPASQRTSVDASGTWSEARAPSGLHSQLLQQQQLPHKNPSQAGMAPATAAPPTQAPSAGAPTAPAAAPASAASAAASPAAAAPGGGEPGLVAQALALLESTRRLVPPSLAVGPSAPTPGAAAGITTPAAAATSLPGNGAVATPGGGAVPPSPAAGVAASTPPATTPAAGAAPSGRSSPRKKGGGSGTAGPFPPKPLFMPYNANRVPAQQASTPAPVSSLNTGGSAGASGRSTPNASGRPSATLEIEPAGPAPGPEGQQQGQLPGRPQERAGVSDAAGAGTGAAGSGPLPGTRASPSGVSGLLGEGGGVAGDEDSGMWLARNQNRSPAMSEISTALTPTRMSPAAQPLPAPPLATDSIGAASSAAGSVNGSGSGGKSEAGKRGNVGSVKAGLTRIGKRLVGL